MLFEKVQRLTLWNWVFIHLLCVRSFNNKPAAWFIIVDLGEFEYFTLTSNSTFWGCHHYKLTRYTYRRGLLPVTVTTRIITCSVGNSYKPSFTTLAGSWPHPRYIYFFKDFLWSLGCTFRHQVALKHQRLVRCWAPCSGEFENKYGIWVNYDISPSLKTNEIRVFCTVHYYLQLERNHEESGKIFQHLAKMILAFAPCCSFARYTYHKRFGSRISGNLLFK